MGVLGAISQGPEGCERYQQLPGRGRVDFFFQPTLIPFVFANRSFCAPLTSNLISLREHSLHRSTSYRSIAKSSLKCRNRRQGKRNWLARLFYHLPTECLDSLAGYLTFSELTRQLRIGPPCPDLSAGAGSDKYRCQSFMPFRLGPMRASVTVDSTLLP